MRYHHKHLTEPIFNALDRYRAELVEHPLLVAAKAGQIERPTLIRFASYQYADSVTWIPMLAQMKEKFGANTAATRQLPSRCRKKRKNGKNELHSRFGKIHLNSCKCSSSTLSTSGKI